MATLKENLEAIKLEKETKILPEHLKSGITAFGVTGTMEAGIDTSDADAVAEDIANGKTAYVNGEKITGNITEIKEGHIPAFDWTWQNWTNSDFIRVYGTLNRDYLLRKNASTDATIQYNELASMLEVTPDKITKGNTILGVEGTAEVGEATDAPVKLFETEEEMQADETAKEGDLAVVYREEIQNAKLDSKFQTAKFPATVVLPEVIADYIGIMYRATDDSIMFDCWGQLDSNYFMMDCWSDTGSITIEYESSDGITYTRTDGGEEFVDFGTEIYYTYPEYWNDAIGYFIQAGGKMFDGLYEYRYDTDNEYGFAKKENIIIEGSTASISTLTLNPNMTTDMIKEAATLIQKEFPYSYTVGYFSEDSKTYTVLMTENNYSSSANIVKDLSTGKYYIGRFVYGLSGSATSIVVKCTYNFETKTYESTTLYSSKTGKDTNYKVTYNESNGVYIVLTEIPDNAYICYNNLTSKQTAIVSTCSGLNTLVTKCNNIPITDKYYYNKYFPAPTQLTLNNTNQLLPDKMAYGSNGIITGDGSIYDNLNLTPKLGINYTALPDSVVTTGFVEINNECDINDFKDNLGVSVSELPLPLSDGEILGKFRYTFNRSTGNIKLYDDKQFLGENTFSELVGIDAYRQSNEYFDCSDNVIVIQANKSGASTTSLIKCTVDYSTSEPTCIWEPLHSGSAISANYDVYNGNVYWGRQNGSNYEIYENSNLLFKFTGVTFSYATNANHVVLDGKLYITDHKSCICFDIDTHAYTTFTLNYDSNTVVNIKLMTSDRKYVVLNDTIYKAENNGLTKISDTSSYLSVGTVTFNGYKTASVIELDSKHYFFTGKGLYCEEDGTFTQVTGLSNYRTQQIIGNTKQELVYNLKSSDTGIRLLQVSPGNLSEYIISNLSHKKYILVTSYEHLNT